MFELEPVGRNMVAICTNISCMLCGAETLVEHVEKKLGIKLGETTPDGRITLKMEEECLAACAGGTDDDRERSLPRKADAGKDRRRSWTDWSSAWRTGLF